ncbi:MAG: divergent polysaccharide deacetylase family protein [Colwellia sp.]
MIKIKHLLNKQFKRTYLVTGLTTGLFASLLTSQHAFANSKATSDSLNSVSTPAKYKVAIVIDDIGYRYTDKHALTLPGNITYSVLPHTPYGKKLALKAYEQQDDVILHIPMESQNRTDLGPGALTKDMTKRTIHESLEKSYREIPFAIGINNHMGSYLTQSISHMAWTMHFLKSNNLFFLDSKTSAHSKAGEIAKHLGVPVQERRVFLDNQLSDAYISKQFNTLVSAAKKHQTAIAIAHPHPETVKVLTKLIPTLAAHNIELVPLSSLYDSPLVRRKIAKKESVKVASKVVKEKEADILAENDTQAKKESLAFETKVEIEEVQPLVIAPPSTPLSIKPFEIQPLDLNP